MFSSPSLPYWVALSCLGLATPSLAHGATGLPAASTLADEIAPSPTVSKEDRGKIRRAALLGAGVSFTATTLAIAGAASSPHVEFGFVAAGVGIGSTLGAPAYFAHRKGRALGHCGTWQSALGGGALGTLGGLVVGSAVALGGLHLYFLASDGWPHNPGAYLLVAYGGAYIGAPLGSALLASSGYVWSAERRSSLSLSISPTYLPQPVGGVPGFALRGQF